MNDNRTNLLFLCTGNSCRSQMAEGYAKTLGNHIFSVQSAGIESHGKNPRAISAMAEDGIDISSQDSTTLTDEMLQDVDIIVTVCGHAREHCPVIPPHIHHLHWPLEDPAKATGSELEIASKFNEIRNEIRSRVKDLVAMVEQAESV